MLIDFLRLAVLPEQPAEYALAAHPQDLSGHPRLLTAAAFPNTQVAALSLGLEILRHAGARMHFHRLSDDEAVLD